jgi:hypothetical protein
MKTSRINSSQPVNGKGVKAIHCPFYNDCLTHAAKRNWQAWTCKQCPNLKLDLICQKLHFIAPYYQLLAEIYPEFKRKYEAAMNALHPEV